MSTIILDTDYLKKLAGEFGTGAEVVEEAARTLKSARNVSFLLGLTSEGKSIKAQLTNEVDKLTKLSNTLSEIKKALTDEANDLETYINTSETQLNQLTDEIKIANGFTPSSGSSTGGTNSSTTSTEAASIPVTPVPESNDPIPNLIASNHNSDVINKVIDFFRNIFSFWKS